MERDDAGTFARLREIRERVVDPRIAEHGGRVVKTAGDGMLLEFGSADAALRCAIDVQRLMSADNQSKPPGERIEFRIGINLGDIIVDGTDIAGDGVNVAARLEALAEPGGICVSAAVREQVHGSLDVGFDDIGEQQVKNIMRPIRVFAVALNAASAHESTIVHAAVRSPQTGPVASTARPRLPLTKGIAMVAASGVAALVIAGSSFMWWNSRSGNPPEPPAMSVGVLPLVAPAGDAATAQRTKSLTRDLSSQLALAEFSIRAVPATARESNLLGPGGIGEFARAINVRYVLEGEVQPGPDATEIRLRLVNGASGEQIWSETVSLKEPATPTSELRSLRTAMRHLRARLIEAEMRRVAAEPGGATTAMDYLIRAHTLEYQEPKSLDLFRRQEALYEEALRRDPDLVPALVGVSEMLEGRLDLEANVDREPLVRRMDEVTKRAVSLNGAASDTWDAHARTLMYMGRWDAALEASAKAIRLDPDGTWPVNSRAKLVSMVGRPTEALTLVAQAIAMDPPGSSRGMQIACEAHLLLGQYDQAIAACEKATGRGGDEFDVAIFLAAAYAHQGSAERAAQEKGKILRRSPGFTIAALRAKRYSVHPEYLRLAEANWYTGLRKAGIAEN